MAKRASKKTDDHDEGWEPPPPQPEPPEATSAKEEKPETYDPFEYRRLGVPIPGVQP